MYGKHTSAITPRMADLVDLYKVIEISILSKMSPLTKQYQSNIETLAAQNNIWYRYQTPGSKIPRIYDVFEPNYLRAGLELKDIHLGDLIFGQEEWARYGMNPGKQNALAMMFAREGNPNTFHRCVCLMAPTNQI